MNDQEVLTKALLRAANGLGLDEGEFASALGVTPAVAVSIAQRQLNVNTNDWTRAVLLVRLYEGLSAMLSGDGVALRAWMRNTNTALGATPIALATTAGLADVVSYIEGRRRRS